MIELIDKIAKKSSEVLEVAKELQVFTIKDLRDHLKDVDSVIVTQCIERLIDSADIDVINDVYFFKNRKAKTNDGNNKTVTLYEYHIDIPATGADIVFDCKSIKAIDTPRKYIAEKNDGFGPNKQDALSKYEINKLWEIEGRGLYVVLENNDIKFVENLVNDFLNKKIEEAKKALDDWNQKRNVIANRFKEERKKEPIELHEFRFNFKEDDPSFCNSSQNVIKAIETDDGKCFEAINEPFEINNNTLLDKDLIGKIQVDDDSNLMLILLEPRLSTIQNLLAEYFNDKINVMKKEMADLINRRDAAIENVNRCADCIPYIWKD